MAKGLELDRVVLLGRTFEEYRRFFALDVPSLRGKAVLDVASGVSSFCAEAHDEGLKVRAADRIYDLPIETLEGRCATDLDYVLKGIERADVYRWDVYRDPEHVRELRERAYKRFLEDYRTHKERYVATDLPKLPFADEQFYLTLASYLLLVYEDQLSYEFHKETVREIMRVTSGEARIYPIVTFEAKRSSFMGRLKADPELSSLRFEEVRTDFEFLRGSNYYLKITRA
jgi:hypothetical protein